MQMLVFDQICVSTSATNNYTLYVHVLFYAYLVISCGDPGVPRNGRRQLLSSTVGSRVVFDCNDGYKLDGNRERTCQSNGQWSGSLPSCSCK